MLFLAPFAVASLSIQWGNNLWAMVVIWVIGSVIIYRLGRFHITLTYVVSFLVFGFLRSYITGHGFLAEVSPITGTMYQLFIFFMITDPRTTVRSSRKAQCVVAFLVAAMEMVLRLLEVVHAPYYSLFLVGPIANLVDIFWLTPPRPVTAKATA
jgi:Na+-translocating ferredoxin:NAD+ oxidoreductase RnfD subunit